MRILMLSLIIVLAWTPAAAEENVTLVFLDNSSSMKRFRFYPRVLALLIGKASLNDRIQVVPFGEGDLNVYDLEQGASLEGTLARNSHTTNFEGIQVFLENPIANIKRVIIISDGEHDVERFSPFTRLTFQEITAMTRVAAFLRARADKHGWEVHTVHLLRGQKVPYSSTLKAALEEVKNTGRAITSSDKIAAVSIDFMQRMAADGSYKRCKDNSEMIAELARIFELEAMDCSSDYQRNIPIDLRFIEVEDDLKKEVARILRQFPFCYDGLSRQFIRAGSRKHSFSLQLEYLSEDIYQVSFEQQVIVEELEFRRREELRVKDIEKFLREMVSALEEKLDDNAELPFHLPTCSQTILLQEPPGASVIPFLKKSYFKIERPGCGAENDIGPADISIVHRRIIVKYPNSICIH